MIMVILAASATCGAVRSARPCSSVRACNLRLPIPWLAAVAPNYQQHANLGVGLVMLAIVLFAPHGVAGLLSRRRGA